MNKIALTSDLEYLALFSLVLIFPKLFLRFKIPTGITALIIGIVVSSFDASIKDDQLFRFLAQIGITSLFVFAGLEVDFKELKQDRVYLSKYVLKWLLVLSGIAYGVGGYFDLPFQESLIFALGIFTPSAGFIINSLHSFKVHEDQEYWIKSKAISKEITAVLLLFLALQGNDPISMGKSVIFYTGLYLILPWMFRFFFKYISPYAPNSEVPFLIALSLMAGVISKELGAYYLVGAFAVGLIASKFKEQIFKEDEESLFMALSSFFNVFLPFYFFHSGMKLSVKNLTYEPFLIAIGLLVVFVPLRIFLIRSSLKRVAHEIIQNTYKISLSLMPTLIFGLVIAGILKERGVVSLNLVYALIIYTLISSLLPTFIFSLSRGFKKK